MDDRIKKLLTTQKSFEDVNLDAESGVMLTNTARPLPLNNISTNVSQSAQAEKERQESTIYRFYGSIKPVVSNVLYNDNIKIFLEKEDDNGIIKKVVPDTVKTSAVLSPEIIEKDGWFGYYDNDSLESQCFETSTELLNDNESSLCQFIPFDPGYDRLNFVDKDGIPNYKLRITYPAYSRNDVAMVTNGGDSVTLNDGIGVVNIFEVKFNDRRYTAFKTSIRHSLEVGDFINLHNFIDTTSSGNELALNDRQFRIFKLGDQTNNIKDRIFILDINPDEIQYQLGKSSIKRVVNGVESEYYMRVFSAITTEETDYEIFPAGFATNSYGDTEAAFNFNKDIDLSENNYRDNLGRPLTEVFLTITKKRNDSNGTLQSDYWSGKTGGDFWTQITPGFITTKHEKVNYNIRAYNDNSFNQTYFNDITPDDTEYMGDIVEYNSVWLEEKILEDIQHRFNTNYRENRSQYSNPVKGDKKEGYFYKPHYRVKVRDFSSYIEDGYQSIGSGTTGQMITTGVPDYATLSYSGSNGTVVMKWRDYLDIGIYDEEGKGVDFPFESGAHYVFLSSRYYLRRQDPPCDYDIIEVTKNIPTEKDELGVLISDPKFIQILDVVTSTNPLGIDVTVRMIDNYLGDYELGGRDVAGGCVDIQLIEINDIDNVC